MELNDTQRAWLAALREEGRRQGNGALQVEITEYDEEGHLTLHAAQCCLGVACEVLDKRGELPKSVHWAKDHNGLGAHLWANHKLVRSFTDGTNDGGEYTSDGYLFDIMLKPLGLTPQLQHDLAKMNDEGKTFGQIADSLEGIWSNA